MLSNFFGLFCRNIGFYGVLFMAHSFWYVMLIRWGAFLEGKKGANDGKKKKVLL